MHCVSTIFPLLHSDDRRRKSVAGYVGRTIMDISAFIMPEIRACQPVQNKKRPFHR